MIKSLVTFKNSIDYIMIAPAYPPFVGGVERHVYEVHHALGRLGLKGRVIVFHQQPSLGVLAEDATWIDSNRLWGWLPKSARLRRALKFIKIISQYPEAKLHFHDFGTIYPILPLLKLLGYLHRTFLTFHGWEGKYPPEPRVISMRQKCAKAVMGNIAVGKFIPKWYGTEPNMITYGGVDVERYSNITPDCNRLPLRVAYVGRFEQDTGILELINAIRAYYRVSGVRIDMHLFGSGRLKEDLLMLQSDSSVLVTVSPPVSDMTKVLERFPIIFASGYLTILEALCARRIVFAYYNNPLREDYLRLHPASRSMFICGNAQDVIDGLTLCHENIHGACQFSEPGWQWAKRQSWDNLAKQYLNLWSLEK